MCRDALHPEGARVKKRFDGLDQYPDFGPPDVMPWDKAPPSEASQVLWITGEPLGDFSSRTLLAHRRLLVKKNGRLGHYWDDMIAAIDQILTERAGE
jgi:hypothetical protein